VVLRDENPVVSQQDVDPAHHVVNVVDVRKDIAGRNYIGLPMVRDDLPSDIFAEELFVDGIHAVVHHPQTLPRRLHPYRPAIKLAEQRPVVSANVDNEAVSEQSIKPRISTGRQIREVLV
jgi:hypothetical protein